MEERKTTIIYHEEPDGTLTAVEVDFEKLPCAKCPWR